MSYPKPPEGALLDVSPACPLDTLRPGLTPPTPSAPPFVSPSVHSSSFPQPLSLPFLPLLSLVTFTFSFSLVLAVFFFSLLSPSCFFISYQLLKLMFPWFMFLLSFQNRRFRDLLFIFPWKSMLFCVCCLVIFSKNFLSSLQSKDEWMLPAK